MFKGVCGVICGAIAAAMLFVNPVEVHAESKMYEVISVNEDLLPENVTIQPRVSIEYDHQSGTESADKWKTRYCWGRTQASQGNIKLSSYTRARYESIIPFGGITGDSDRVWSKVEGGPSYAESGTVSADTFSQWVAHTYYGTTD